MSIRPVSDLVLDVARAADPLASRAAAARLSAFAGADGEAGFDPFASLQPGGEAGSDPGADPLPAPEEALAAALGPVTGRGAPVLSPAQQFESFLVRSSMESMSAGTDAGVFGDRVAGPVWRSLLAEKIGDAVALRGGLGIAELLDRSGRGERA